MKSTRALTVGADDTANARPFTEVVALVPVKTMFMSISQALLTSCTVVLEGSDAMNSTMVQYALEGLVAGARIACSFDLGIERETFVRTLATLSHVMDPKTISSRNVDAIRAIVKLAVAEAATLSTSWVMVLRTLSMLERLQTLSSHGQSDIIHTDPQAELVKTSTALEYENAAAIAATIDQVTPPSQGQWN